MRYTVGCGRRSSTSTRHRGVFARRRGVRRQEIDAYLPLLYRALRRLLDITPDLADIVAVVARADGDGLDEELVAATRVGRWVVFHGLQQDLYLHILPGVDAAGVWADAISGRSLSVSSRVLSRMREMGNELFGGGGLDFEGYRVAVRVAETEDLRDFVLEGA